MSSGPVIELRRELHRHPCLSGAEKETENMLKDFLVHRTGGRCVDLEKGFLWVFDGKEKGGTVAFRTDTDAVPVEDKGEKIYSSANRGVSHACGHDGHMAVLCSLALQIDKDPPEKGTAVLVFQPSEETGEGAISIVNDNKFAPYAPDMIFGFHNIPGYKKGAVLIREGVFSCTSTGMEVRIKGRSAHAAEKEMGKSPVRAVIKLLDRFCSGDARFPEETSSDITVIHVSAGEKAFGTTPGKAEIGLTLRAVTDKDLKELKEKCETIVTDICRVEGLDHLITYREEFPALVNSGNAVGLIRTSASDLGFDIIEPSLPFKWSEDFANYTVKYQGAYFGIGAGADHPSLHNPDYDFPDDIIVTAGEVLYGIYKMFMSSQ